MPKNKGKQTIQGKAFEYACLNAIVEKLSEENKEFRIVDNSAYKTAAKNYNGLTIQEQETYKLIAPFGLQRMEICPETQRNIICYDFCGIFFNFLLGKSC